MTILILSNLLTAALIASWLKPDWLHRLASIGAKPKGFGAPMKPSTEEFIASWLPERDIRSHRMPDTQPMPLVRPAVPVWQLSTGEQFEVITRGLDMRSVT